VHRTVSNALNSVRNAACETARMQMLMIAHISTTLFSFWTYGVRWETITSSMVSPIAKIGTVYIVLKPKVIFTDKCLP
jgi:uncharacterized protein with PQ loop repeat